MRNKQTDEIENFMPSMIKRIAKKDHIINQNEVYIVIKEGDDLDTLNIPERFNETLKTEKIVGD